MSRTVAAVGVGTRRRTLALAVPLAGLTAGLFLPPVLVGLPLAGQRALIVTLITILLWTGELLEPGVAALVGVTLLALSGATRSLRDALQGFANPVPFFLIGVLTMGVAVVRSGLAERLARTILERARGRSLAVYLQLVLSFPVLTFLLPSATTRSGILIHIYDEVFTLGGVQRGAEVAKAIMLYALYRRGFARGLPMPEPAHRRPISGTEWRTIVIILSASALWLTDGIHHLDPALPAMLAFAALLTPGLGPLVWPDLDQGIGWSNFFVIAASISLAHALVASGAAPWLGRVLVGGLPALGDSALAVVILLMLGATLLRAVVPNISGFLALALPIAMSVGREAGINPLVCALVVMITGDAVVYYPAQSSSALVIYERGHVSAGEVLRFGLWMTLVGWVAILVVALPWWALVGEPLRVQ